MAVDIDDPRRLRRATVIGRDGTKLGTVGTVYLDNTTGRPAWVAVRTGLFGLNVALVPLGVAELRGEELHVPYDREQLRSAPHRDPDLALSPQDEVDLFAHYGLAHGDTGRDAAGSDDAMTRSEEWLRVRTESQPTERVRLRKYLVTSYEQVTVPVRREEVRLDHAPPGTGDPTFGTAEVGDPEVTAVPVGGAGPADRRGSDEPGSDERRSDRLRSDGPGSDERMVVLHEERPVVRTETVPVERVRLGKRTVTEQETVGGEVRREEVEVDTDPDVR